jgi:hypothetical protein
MNKILTPVSIMIVAAFARVGVSEAAASDPHICCSTLTSTCTESGFACGQPADGAFQIAVPMYGADITKYSPPILYAYTTSAFGYARGTCVFLGGATIPQYCWWLAPAATEYQRYQTPGVFSSGNGAFATYAPTVAECYLEALGDGPPLTGTCTSVYGGIWGDCCVAPNSLYSTAGLSPGAPTYWTAPPTLAPVGGFHMHP